MPRPADIDSLVIQSGRTLEHLARELIPEEKEVDGKPLMLGARMYRLRDQLDKESWQAYHDWARERNAYVHGESQAIADPATFEANFEEVRSALEALQESSADANETSLTPIVATVVIVALGLLYAC